MASPRRAREDHRAVIEDLLEAADIRLDSYRMDTADDIPGRDLNLAGELAAQATARTLLLIADSLNAIHGELQRIGKR